MPIIMGRKTFESMNGELPGRINIVISKKEGYHPEGAIVVSDINEALKKAAEADTKEIFIIGGGQIFKQTLDITDRIFLTRVHVTLEGDTHYPEIDYTKWKKVSEKNHPADEKHKYPFTFEVWERK